MNLPIQKTIKPPMQAEIRNIGYLLGSFFCCYELLIGKHDSHMFNLLKQYPSKYFVLCSEKLRKRVEQFKKDKKVNEFLNEMQLVLSGDLPDKLSEEEERSYEAGYANQVKVMAIKSGITI